MPKSPNKLLLWAESTLSTISSTPRLDAEVLLAHLLGCSRGQLLTAATLPAGLVQQFSELMNKRAQGEPVAYLVGHKEFYGREFTVDNRVLIPRPETERLVELALRQSGKTRVSSTRVGSTPLSSTPGVKTQIPTPGVFPSGVEDNQLTIVDLGTGSGNIIVTLASELNNRPAIRFIATDVSKAALEVAKQNAKNHGVLERIEFLQGSLLEPLCSELPVTGQLFIVANLPYLADHWLDELPRDGRSFEPEAALAGGAGGLELYRQLFRQLRDLSLHPLSSIIHLLCEHDPRQLTDLQRLSHKYLDHKGISHTDLAHLPRVLEINLL